MPQRLPNLGESPYKTILDGFLEVVLNTDGTMRTGVTYPTPTVTGAITATSNAGPHKFGTGDAAAGVDTPFLINMAVAGIANQNVWGLISALNFTKAASGTHPVVAGADLDFPHISGSGAAITTIAAVRIGADGAAPYAAATNVYALEVANGIVLIHGGAAGDITKPGIRLANAQVVTFRSAADTDANGAHIFHNSSNVLTLGTNQLARLQIDASGSIAIGTTFGGIGGAAGRFITPNNAGHYWLDASGGATNAMFLLGDSTNTLLIGAGNSTRISISSGGTITFVGYGSGSGAVSVGAADSGGAGFKLLRVPN